MGKYSLYIFPMDPCRTMALWVPRVHLVAAARCSLLQLEARSLLQEEAAKFHAPCSRDREALKRINREYLLMCGALPPTLMTKASRNTLQKCGGVMVQKLCENIRRYA